MGIEADDIRGGMLELARKWEKRAELFPHLRTAMACCAFELRILAGGDLLEDFRGSAEDAEERLDEALCRILEVEADVDE